MKQPCSIGCVGGPSGPLRALFTRLLACAAAALCFSAAAQTWQTVADIPYGAGVDAYGATADPSGNLFVAGDVWDSTQTLHAVIWKSADDGATWTTVDASTDAGGPQYNAIASDKLGTLYAAGTSFSDSNGSETWFVRRSLDGGTTWATVDSLTNPYQADPFGVATDSGGNAYVVGSVEGSTSVVWTVRKSADGGNSWSTVDSFQSGAVARALNVCSHPTAGIFVVGLSYNTSGKKTTRQWTTRRSQDGGATWKTVDTYSAPSGLDVMGASVDAVGNIYVAGQVSSAWVGRKSSDGGNTWATVDSFQNSATVIVHNKPQTQYYLSVPYAIVTDTYGNVFVVGSAGSANGAQWVVRENPVATGTWQNVDVFQAPFTGASATAAAADALGHVFVAGHGTDAAGALHWLIRKH